MEIPAPKSDQDDIYSYGFDSHLNRTKSQTVTQLTPGVVDNQTNPSTITSGTISGALVLGDGFIRSEQPGWQVNADGTSTGLGQDPGGNTFEVQYNNAGVFAGDPQFTYNPTTDVVTLETINSVTAQDLTLQAGASGSIILAGGSSGNASLAAGSNANLSLSAPNNGNATLSAGSDGNVTVSAGTNGNVSLVTGSGSAAGGSKKIRLSSSNGSGASSAGGDVEVQAGDAGSSGFGGSVNLTAGASSTSGGGGSVNVTAGNSTASGAGNISISGGTATGASGNGGIIELQPGNRAGSSTKGRVRITDPATAQSILFDTDKLSGGNKTLTFQNFNGTATIQTNALTSTRVPFANSSGILGDNANFVYNNTTDTLELGNNAKIVNTTFVKDVYGIPGAGPSDPGGTISFIGGDGGVTAGVGGDISFNGGNGIAAGANGGNVDFIVGTPGSGGTYGNYRFQNDALNANGVLDFASIATTDKTFSFQNISGTVAIQASTVSYATLDSGTYTPTLFNVANLDGSTAYISQYMRVGHTVTVSGKVDIDPTLTVTSTQLGISLPIASNLATQQQCAGTAFASGIASQGAAILGDATNDRAQMQWVASDVSSQPMYYQFVYQVI